jgi:hypothetical protein
MLLTVKSFQLFQTCRKETFKRNGLKLPTRQEEVLIISYGGQFFYFLAALLLRSYSLFVALWLVT